MKVKKYIEISYENRCDIVNMRKKGDFYRVIAKKHNLGVNKIISILKEMEKSK